MTAAGGKNLRRRTVLAMAGAVIALAGASNAFANSDPVDLKVVDRETGQTLRVWAHHGRLFVAGRPGARYSLRVTNHTDHRVQVVHALVERRNASVRMVLLCRPGDHPVAFCAVQLLIQRPGTYCLLRLAGFPPGFKFVGVSVNSATLCV